jgi:uncharacterized membrane protein
LTGLPFAYSQFSGMRVRRSGGMAAALRHAVLLLRLMQTQTNVSNPERWVSVIAGAAIAAFGLKRRSLGGLALAGIGGGLVWRGATGHCAIYESLGLSTNGHDESQVSVPYGRGIRVEKSVTINAPPEQLYASGATSGTSRASWSTSSASTCRTSFVRTGWRKGPAGTKAEWDAEIINEIPNELIGWRSVDGSNVRTPARCTSTRASGNRGTEVKVVLRYDPPGGSLGAVVAKLFGEEPSRQVQEDLRRLKQIMETGESFIRAVMERTRPNEPSLNGMKRSALATKNAQSG